MKKAIITIILSIVCLVSQAQIKMYSNGDISLQSLTGTGGIQIDAIGKSTFEPIVTTSSTVLTQTKVRAQLVRAWNVKYAGNATLNPVNRFYVTGKGDTYANGYYTISGGGGGGTKGYYPIENPSEMLFSLNGYYYDNDEFEGFEPDFIDNPEIAPEAVEGLMKDLKINKSLELSIDELEAVLPEAIRHDPEGMIYINYSAIVPVLVEAFKEQQARIQQLEDILKDKGLLKP